MANCSACPGLAAVQWSRRPTAAELAVFVAVENDRRSAVLADADPAMPPPIFGDMPTAANTVVPVYGCSAHGITLDLAPFVHLSTCTAPNMAFLPHCDCNPEPLTQTAPEQPAQPALPAGW